MKRSEPDWKRESARQHCKKQYNKVWDNLNKRPRRPRYIKPGVRVYTMEEIDEMLARR